MNPGWTPEDYAMIPAEVRADAEREYDAYLVRHLVHWRNASTKENILQHGERRGFATHEESLADISDYFDGLSRLAAKLIRARAAAQVLR